MMLSSARLHQPLGTALLGMVGVGGGEGKLLIFY